MHYGSLQIPKNQFLNIQFLYWLLIPKRVDRSFENDGSVLCHLYQNESMYVLRCFIKSQRDVNKVSQKIFLGNFKKDWMIFFLAVFEF